LLAGAVPKNAFVVHDRDVVQRHLFATQRITLRDFTT
jgi:hypothetical protein